MGDPGLDDARDGSRTRIRRALGAGAAVLFVVGLTVGALYDVFYGTSLLALGVVLLAARGYLGSGDRAVTGVLVFVAFAAAVVQAVERFLAP